jgi:O-succinylbenzoic acid--CoA ligase
MAGVAFHCLLPLERGSGVVFSRLPFLQWSAAAGALFRELSVELVTLNPFLLEMLLRGGIDPQWKGAVVSLTAPLKKPLLAAFALASGRRPREIYGMTEAAGPVLLDGKSLGAETRVSATYELELRGPQLLLGYSSAGRFEPTPEWFRTGDIFTVEDGRHLHQARERDLIDTGGRKVSPRLIEEAAERLPGIGECLAFGMSLAGVERPALLYVREAGCALPPEELALELESYLAKTLSPELRPKWWQEVDSLPRQKGGKPNRKLARSQWERRAKAPTENTSTS